MKSKYDIVWFVLMLALIAALFYNAEHLIEASDRAGNGMPRPATIIRRVVPDTAPDTVYYPTAEPVYRDTGATRWRSLPVDTMAILADYISRNAYRRVLKDDTSALIVISDTVSQNRLMGYSLVFHNRRATLIESHTTIVGNCNTVNWVVSASVAVAVMPERTRLMGGLRLTDHRQRSYGISTDPTLKAWMIDVAIPIWRQRKVEQPE